MRIYSEHIEGDFALTNAAVHDGLSTLYEVDARIVTKDLTVHEADLIGKRFCIEIDLDDDAVRYLSGICTEARALGTDNRQRSFSIRISPWTWHLTRNVDSRVYQKMTCAQIAAEVFRKYNFSLFDDRTSDLPVIEYHVQYNESDLAFVCRTLEEHGVYFFHRQDQSGETLVLCDSIAAHPSIGDLRYHQAEGIAGRSGDYIERIESQKRVIPTQVTKSDVNFTRRSQVSLGRRRAVDMPGFAEDLAVFEYGPSHADPDEGEAQARRSIEALVAGQHVLNGAGNARMLTVGSRFSLIEHDVGELNTEYLCTAATYALRGFEDGSGSDTEYYCSFELIPSARPYRPAKLTPAPRIHSVLTAVVTGPSGEEIYTDEYGRVKIQFHWDRYGPSDQTSSCWVRVATPWAGSGWGSLVIPRIGQEVVVQFENGNPDRPIITGMLFNAENMPPYQLPAAASQSGFRTNTTKGGGGANEIQFDDKAGQEQLNITGQRDYSLTVKNDASVNVGYETGEPGSFSFNVHQDRVESISNGDYNLGVRSGSRSTFVATNDGLEIGGDRSEIVTGTLGSEAAHIKMNGKTDLKAESPDIDINGKSKTKIGSAAIEVDGTTVKMTGAQEISLTVGGSSIVLNAAGVTILGPLVKIN